MSTSAKQAFSTLPRDPERDVKKVILDLQGGGAYGAYTTGVAIQFLTDPKIQIVGVQGTSAGAMVACIIADAINSAPTYNEGRIRAVQHLITFWDEVVNASAPMMHALDVANPMYFPHLAASNIAAHSNDHGDNHTMLSPFKAMRMALSWLPMADISIDALEAPWKRLHANMLHGDLTRPRESSNLPILHVLGRHQDHIREIFENASRGTMSLVPRDYNLSAAFATDTLRRIVSKSLTSEAHPDDHEDRILTHAASGKFVTLHINTALEASNGALTNVIHGGQDVTLKALMGSAALRGFFQPSMIKGARHIDGGYMENGCLSVPASQLPKHDGLVIVGTNRPVDLTITPQQQSDIHPTDLADTRGLVLHHMYAEAVLRAEQWRAGMPTIHLITNNHTPDCDWTAKQNVSHWHIDALRRRGESDGISALAQHRDLIGVTPTVSRTLLEEIALEGQNYEAKTPSRPSPAPQPQPNVRPRDHGWANTGTDLEFAF